MKAGQKQEKNYGIQLLTDRGKIKFMEMMDKMDATIKNTLNTSLGSLEKHFDADVIFFYGEISFGADYGYRAFIEYLTTEKNRHNRLVIFLNTPGGSVETVEKLVNINRHFYKEVYFVVPDMAMSAGTVFCMSGDKIYMDYSSSLGPIDPQVFNSKQYVPALGYLDKVNEMIAKSSSGNLLSQAELVFLQQQDIAFLRLCEQQRDLTIKLIKDWLVKYKFKNWNEHSDGSPVTDLDKQKRAEEIANKLGNNKEWLSHGRCIDIRKLKEMKLEIDDYSENENLKRMIRDYNSLIMSYISRFGYKVFLHSRNYF